MGKNNIDNFPMVRLGDYIVECDERNSSLQYGLSDVKGMTITKEIIPTKANLSGNDLSKFKIVYPNEFVYNPRTHGKKIGLGLNDSDNPFLISWNNIAFKILDKQKLLPTYLYLYFNRDEWDRLACFNSWGSSTEVFSWKELCRMQIPLPSPDEQQKVVNAWKALRVIKEQNAARVAPLMQLCQSYIQKIKKSCSSKYRIGNAIKIVDAINKDGYPYDVLGLNSNKEFMPTVASIESINTNKYKVVTKGMFAFSGMQTGRDICIRIALYNNDTPALISPAYTTFTLDENEPILPEFLMMIFKNPEMDRLGWFYSDSSVRANLDWDRFIDIEIPKVPVEVQHTIVNIYKCANEAKQIAEEADRLSREVCPALLQHITHSTTKQNR